MDPFNKYVEDNVTLMTDETIRLGPLSLRLTSNIAPFPALQYFSHVARSPYNGEKSDFELWCVSPERANLNREYLREQVDGTYRAARFMEGYYATDHFGPPLFLVTRGRRYYVFGEQFEQVVWPYFVKYFLTLHSLADSALHIKAAAFAIGSTGTLVLGRSGSGKSVLLLQLCRSGAQFVTNTHALIKDGCLSGVASSMRVRPGEWFSDLAQLTESRPSIKSGELNIDPCQVLDVFQGDSIAIRNLCIVDFKGAGCCTVDRISEEIVYDYAEQFVLAINAYRLEEDLLDFYANDFRQFAHVYARMKAQLHDLVRGCNRYYISCDVLDQKCRDTVFSLLS